MNVKRIGHWIPTFTGRQYWPLDPRPTEVCLADIAHSLAFTCRFNGNCRTFYSNAEHSINVARYLPPELQLEGLLHDGHETYCGDMLSPLKHSLPDYYVLERLNEECVRKAFDLRSKMDPLVKQIDARMTLSERDFLFVYPPHEAWEFEHLGALSNVKFRCYPHVEAELAFLKAFSDIKKGVFLKP